jgi:transcriptional regulator with XRE-family HTH domain
MTCMRARELREQGLDYEDIAGALGVSKSSVSLWVRDMPRPERLSYEESRKRSAEGARRYWAAERECREARREVTRAAAAAEIASVSSREILIAGAIAYWCEGTKRKPHNPSERVIFINSDPVLIRFFLRFLGEAGVDPARLRFRVHIHETADVSAAEEFWLEVTGAEPAQFQRTTLKRHNPRTVRKNVGADYHGCLRLEVKQSADLYRRIEGWGPRCNECALLNAWALALEGWPSLEPGLAPGEGFEPSLTGPKPVVMPLDHPGPCLAANSTGPRVGRSRTAMSDA